MKNILKARLINSQQTNDPNIYNVQVLNKGNMDISDVIDELLREGIELNHDEMMEVIIRFNRKSAELVLTGFNVNTGLVKMSPIIKGQLYQKKWNPSINSISVAITGGNDLHQAVADSSVEMIGEQDEPIDIYNIKEKTIQLADACLSDSTKVKLNSNIDDKAACGIDFHNWLHKR
ncbi:MAG: DNA-binding domain-containing protein [Paludibacter sp.]